MESHLLYDGEPSTRDEGRRRMLSDAGVGSGSCWRNPRTWGLIIGLLVVIASIVLIIVLVTLPTTGKNAKQVKSIIDNSKKATLGFNRLGEMLDTFGSRISGSMGLNNSLTWMAQKMAEDGFKVALEPVQVGVWVRGAESLEQHSPMSRPLPMLGLGRSVGTPPEGITAQVLVVKDDAELDKMKDLVPGKIVLYNNAWDTSYGKTVTYRSRGAIKAARYGAVAALIRSVTPFSLQTPHTGVTHYDETVTKIPIAAITVEDAAYMGRVQARTNGAANITATLKMSAQMLAPTTSYNILADYTGSVLPNEYVVMGGHIDSWDVGQGAQDDAGGVFVAWEAIRILKSAGLRPQRTIRVVGWVDEEQGGSGANQYVIDHAKELDRTVLAMESDQGTFKATDLLFKGTAKGYTAATKMASAYFTKYLDVHVSKVDYADADITPLAERGVPTFSLRTEGNVAPNPKYFYYHHTHADTFDKIDLADFQNNAAVFATAAWVASAGEFPLR